MAAGYSRIGTTAEIGEFDQTIISRKVELVAQQMLPIERLITVTDKGRNTGRVTNVVQIGAQSLADLSESDTTGMGDASNAFASTNRAITQTTKGRDIWVTLLASVTGTGPTEADIVHTLAMATVKKLAGDMMAKYTEGTGANLIGVAATPVTYLDHFLPGFQRLAVGQVPGRKNWILPVLQIAEVGGESQFSEWQKLGQAWLEHDMDIQAGYLGIAPFGVGCWFSNDYTAASGNNGIMLAQSAMRIEFTMRPTVSIDNSEMGVNTSSQKIGMRTIYGINGTRDTSTTNAGIVAIRS